MWRIAALLGMDAKELLRQLDAAMSKRARDMTVTLPPPPCQRQKLKA